MGLDSIFFSDVNFSVRSPIIPCILSCVNVKLTDVMKLSCILPNLFWEHVNNVPSRPLTNITKCVDYAVTRNFANSVPADMDFRHCLFPYYINDQAVYSCGALLIKTLGFTFTHTEGGGCNFSALLIKEKNCCASTSYTGTRLFDCCCHSPENFIE